MRSKYHNTGLYKNMTMIKILYELYYSLGQSIFIYQKFYNHLLDLLMGNLISNK